jgi:cytochrome c oxidase subunit 1
MSYSATANSDAELNYLNCEKGLMSWLATHDHKRIGLMYLVAMIAFFLVGGVAALVMRTHLAVPDKALLTPDEYNIMFTMHGVIMIFLFIVPGIPAVMGNFLLPLMIGAKDVAFPKLNLWSWYVYMIGAFMGLVGVLQPFAPPFIKPFFEWLGIGIVDSGWTFYAPYSIETGTAVIWMTGAAFILGFSSIMTGLNFIVTVHKLRAPGMTWNRLPVFVWATYATAIIQTLATPVVGISLVLLIMERAMGVGIFDPKMGGDPILFQHMFWFYSHPVVYIMVLPAFGIVGEIIPVFSRKPLFGYRMVCIASLCIALVGFLIWAHHMFTSGISDVSAFYFSIATFGVAIPTAIKVFNWVGTMYKGSIRFDTPMLYAMGFVFLFMIAGTTGVYLAVLATDIYYHDTYFVVAHFHYTIQGGAVISLMGALHFWFPKMSGKMYNETLGKITWFLVFFGFNLTFIPQFYMGMEGMPRRYYDYPDQYSAMHVLSTVGAYFNGLGYTLALFHLVYLFFYGKTKAPANPYGSLSPEWQTSSPPPQDNFKDPVVITDWTYGYGTPIEGHGHDKKVIQGA